MWHPYIILTKDDTLLRCESKKKTERMKRARKNLLTIYRADIVSGKIKLIKERQQQGASMQREVRDAYRLRFNRSRKIGLQLSTCRAGREAHTPEHVRP